MTPGDVAFIVVHCAATRSDPSVDIRDVDAWHRARGWNGCGYHYVIPTDGRIQGGRALNQSGAHTKGHNYHSWGVCLVGGLDAHGRPDNNFTPEQMASLRMLLASLHQIAPQAEILGHRDLSPDIDGDGVVERHEWLKDCPCFDVRTWWGMVPAAAHA